MSVLGFQYVSSGDDEDEDEDDEEGVGKEDGEEPTAKQSEDQALNAAMGAAGPGEASAVVLPGAGVELGSAQLPPN